MGAQSLSHVQAMILQLITEAASAPSEGSSGRVAGIDLRSQLKAEGYGTSGPGFYQIMGRLEDNGYIKACESKVMIGGKSYRQKEYSITGAGRNALEEYRKLASKVCRRPAFVGETLAGIRPWFQTPTPALRGASGAEKKAGEKG
jgi:DNA-binding PadR family transcriptional regulator